jgi:hypothetical protein
MEMSMPEALDREEARSRTVDHAIFHTWACLEKHHPLTENVAIQIWIARNYPINCCSIAMPLTEQGAYMTAGELECGWGLSIEYLAAR